MATFDMSPLRTQRIFGDGSDVPLSAPTVNDSGAGNSQVQQPNANGQPLVNIPPPQHAMSDMFMNSMSQQPTYGDYRPSLARRFGSMFVGIAHGPQEQQNFLTAPYLKATQDWRNKMGYAQEAAQREQQQNVEGQTGAIATAKAGLEQTSIDARMQQIQNNLDVANNKLTQQASQFQQKLDAQQKENDRRDNIRQQFNDIRAKVANGGTLYFTPDNKAVMVHKDGTTQPIDQTLWTPQDMQELKGDQAIRTMHARINAEGTFGAPIQTYDADGKPGDVIQVDKQGNVQKVALPQGDTTKAPPKAPTNSGANQLNMIQVRAKQIADSHPELKQYMQFDAKTGKFVGMAKKPMFNITGAPWDDNILAAVGKAVNGEIPIK